MKKIQIMNEGATCWDCFWNYNCFNPSEDPENLAENCEKFQR